MKKRFRVAIALFRRWLWLLWPPRTFAGWRANTVSEGREYIIFGRSFFIGRITQATACRGNGFSITEEKVFYDEETIDGIDNSGHRRPE